MSPLPKRPAPVSPRSRYRVPSSPYPPGLGKTDAYRDPRRNWTADPRKRIRSEGYKPPEMAGDAVAAPPVPIETPRKDGPSTPCAPAAISSRAPPCLPSIEADRPLTPPLPPPHDTQLSAREHAITPAKPLNDQSQSLPITPLPSTLKLDLDGIQPCSANSSNMPTPIDDQPLTPNTASSDVSEADFRGPIPHRDADNPVVLRLRRMVSNLDKEQRHLREENDHLRKEACLHTCHARDAELAAARRQVMAVERVSREQLRADLGRERKTALAELRLELDRERGEAIAKLKLEYEHRVRGLGTTNANDMMTSAGKADKDTWEEIRTAACDPQAVTRPQTDTDHRNVGQNESDKREAVLSKKIEFLTASNDALRKQVAVIGTLRAQVDDLTKKNDSLETAKIEINNRLADAERCLDQELDNVRKELGQRTIELAEANASLDKQRSETPDRIKILNSVVQEKNKREELGIQLAQVKAAKAAVEKQLSQQKETSEQLIAKLSSEAKKDKKRLQLELSEKVTARDEIQAELLEERTAKTQLAQELAEKQQALNQLDILLAKEKKWGRQARSELAQAERTEEQLGKLREQSQQSKDRLMTDIKKLQCAQESLQADLRVARNERSGLEKKLGAEQAAKEKVSSQLRQAKDTMKSYKQESEALEKRLGTERAKADAMAADAERAREEALEAKQEEKRHRNLLEVMTKDLEEEMKKIDQEKVQLKQKVINLEAGLTDALKDASRLQETESEVERLAERVMQLEEEVAAAKIKDDMQQNESGRERSELEQERDRLTARVTELETKAVECRLSILKLEKTISHYEWAEAAVDGLADLATWGQPARQTARQLMPPPELPARVRAGSCAEQKAHEERCAAKLAAILAEGERRLKERSARAEQSRARSRVSA
ncbi:hypothetical protein IAU60_000217 [Kwoniella sp. DSM 27419]